MYLDLSAVALAVAFLVSTSAGVCIGMPLWKVVLYSVLMIAAGYAFAKSIYNIYLHPLSGFPGPKWAAASNIWYCIQWTSGRFPNRMRQVHEKYGPVVRVAPNELSYSTATSWRDIYGHYGARKVFLKSHFYRKDHHDKVSNLLNEGDPIVHGAQLRLFSSAFSAKALQEQEPSVHRYVDMFVEKLGEHGSGVAGMEITKWYNYLTFDIIGDLAFGKSFDAVRDGKPHFWISVILDTLYARSLSNVYRRFPTVQSLLPIFSPKRLSENRDNHFMYSREKVLERIQSTTTRKDFFSKVLAQEDASTLSIPELTSNSHLFIIAGSETTATTLAGLTYYLLKNPATYSRLVREIRDAFTEYSQITSVSTSRLRYLAAVIDETLRIYPPVPVGLPRASPGETVDGVFVPAGTEVSTSQWVAGHDAGNFHDPDSFLPERWLDMGLGDVKEASQPFSMGSRICLGKNLAMLELRLVIAKMFYAHDFEMVNTGLDWEGESRSYPVWNKPELFVRIHPREGAKA